MIISRAGCTKYAKQLSKECLALISICFITLAIYACQAMLGQWTTNPFHDLHNLFTIPHWRNIVLEVGMLSLGVLTIWRVSSTILTFPLFFVMYRLIHDLFFLFFGKNALGLYQPYWLMFIAGSIIVLIAYTLDKNTTRDYAFWGYLSGVALLWKGLCFIFFCKNIYPYIQSEMLIYGILNLALLLIGMRLRRIVFLVCGSIGVICYIGQLMLSLYRGIYLNEI